MRWALVIALLGQPLAAQEFFTLKGHGGPIMDIAVHGDRIIATASFDNSIGLWTENGSVWMEGHRAAVNTIAFGITNTLISGGDDFAVRHWWATPSMTHSMRAKGTLGHHTAKVTDIAMHPHLGEAASASWDGTIGIWDLFNKEPKNRFLKAPSGVNAVAYSHDELSLYAATIDGKILGYSLDVPGPPQVLVRHGFGINELIVTDNWLAYGATDGGTRMIDLETGEQIADFTLERRPILSMAYSPATKQLAVGDGQGYIMMIDTEKRRITHDFRAARNGPIWALAFSPDGQTIYAGGIEDIVYAWPVATMTQHEPMAGGKRTFLEDPKSLPNGERQFKRKCSICHTLSVTR